LPQHFTASQNVQFASATTVAGQVMLLAVFGVAGALLIGFGIVACADRISGF